MVARVSTTPANGCYVSSDGLAGDIDDLRQWRRKGVTFVVLGTETGADVTRVLLA
jgi:hypothetical protein